jgi:hypothetical protein
MGKRATGVGQNGRNLSKKTAKRLATKKEMLANKAAKGRHSSRKVKV